LKVLREAIKTGRYEKCKAYATAAGKLYVIGQLVLRGTCIVLPSQLRPQVISFAHEGHLGIVETKQNLRGKVWWPGIDKAAERFCKSSHGCQPVARPNPPEPLTSTTLPEGPWQDLAIDLLGPLPPQYIGAERKKLRTKLLRTIYHAQWFVAHLFVLWEKN